MNTRAKSILILLGTLAVGIAIGALATSVIFNARLDSLHALRGPGGMSERILSVIQPENAEQEAEIRAILDASGQRLHELRRSQIRPFRMVIDSMYMQIQPLLTDEQNERLQTWREEDRGRLRNTPGPRKGTPGERRRGRAEEPSS